MLRTNKYKFLDFVNFKVVKVWWQKRASKNNDQSLKKSFGKFKSEKSSDEIIDEIYKSRTFSREIQEL